MKKAEFLALLRERLADFSNEDAEKSAAFYSEMIDDRMEEGMTEEEAVAALGSLDDIVRSIRQETHGDREPQRDRESQRDREPQREVNSAPVMQSRNRHLSVAGIVAIVIGVVALIIAVTILMFSLARLDDNDDYRYVQNTSQNVQQVDASSAAQNSQSSDGGSVAQNSQGTANNSISASAGFTREEYLLDMSSVQQLSVSSLIDEIRIMPGDGTELRAVYQQSDTLWYEMRQENGTLYIEQKSSQEQITRQGRDDDDYKLWIYLPQGAVTLEVSTTNGEIDITNLSLPETTIMSSTNGDIDLANCTGSTVQITSTNGDIDTEACVINDLQVNNTAGSIDLEIDAQTATVVNASGEVDVKLRGTNSDYTVQTQTTSGRAKAGTGTGSRMISITTESGEIEYEFVNHWD